MEEFRGGKFWIFVQGKVHNKCSISSIANTLHWNKCMSELKSLNFLSHYFIFIDFKRSYILNGTFSYAGMQDFAFSWIFENTGCILCLHCCRLTAVKSVTEHLFSCQRFNPQHLQLKDSQMEGNVNGIHLNTTASQSKLDDQDEPVVWFSITPAGSPVLW